ncbi:hypothetical protein RF55_15318 [Lasius niger]|uniref:Uncharacterized protein n=1 Tax=Lasius niger TaxID=67767 RepID=A0A0J7K6J3_LASNI|nr:hypothetical protein RF55_15318 [Lasius niger]
MSCFYKNKKVVKSSPESSGEEEERSDRPGRSSKRRSNLSSAAVGSSKSAALGDNYRDRRRRENMDSELSGLSEHPAPVKDRDKRKSSIDYSGNDIPRTIKKRAAKRLNSKSDDEGNFVMVEPILRAATEKRKRGRPPTTKVYVGWGKAKEAARLDIEAAHAKAGVISWTIGLMPETPVP